MSKHEAEPTAATRIKEHTAFALATIGHHPDGTGTHRDNDKDGERA